MVFHLTVDARRPPSWLSGVHRGQHAARLRTALGPLARAASLRWRDETTLAIVLRYEPDARWGRDAHQAALTAVIRAADRAGLNPVGSTVTRVVSHWTQGAIAGALAGVGLSQTQEDHLGPVITLGAIAVGAVVGAFLHRDAPVFRALRLPYAGWRLVPVEPEVSTPRFRVGLA